MIDITDDGVENGVLLDGINFYVSQSVIDSSKTAIENDVPVVNSYNSNTKLFYIGADLFDPIGIANGNLSTLTMG